MTRFVTKATPISYIDSKCHISKLKTSGICLIGYSGFIAWGQTHKHTHTHAHTHIHIDVHTKVFSRNQAAQAWFNNIITYHCFYSIVMHLCILDNPLINTLVISVISYNVFTLLYTLTNFINSINVSMRSDQYFRY